MSYAGLRLGSCKQILVFHFRSMDNTMGKQILVETPIGLRDHPVGMWIDTHEAFIIRLTEAGDQVQRIALDKAHHKAILKAKHHGSRFSDRMITEERKELEKLAHERTEYLRRVMDVIGSAGRIVVFGPAQMKNHLLNALGTDPRWRKSVIGTVTTDRMTANQRVAWVKRYFR